MNLDLSFVILTNECKRPLLHDGIVVREFVIQLGHVRVHEFFSSLFQLFIMQQSSVPAKDCAKEVVFAIEFIGPQVMPSLEISSEL